MRLHHLDADAAPSSSSPLSAFHAAVLDLAGLLERPLVPPAGAEVHTHGAPASVAVKPHHSHHHHHSATTSTASSGSESSGGDDRRSSGSGGSGGRSDDFEGLNFAQVRVSQCHAALSIIFEARRERGGRILQSRKRKKRSFFFLRPSSLSRRPFFFSHFFFLSTPRHNKKR